MPAGSTDFWIRPTGSVAAVAASDGCAHHPLIHRLTRPGVAGRDLADAVHAVCAVHGGLTGLFEDAQRRQGPESTARSADDWLIQASAAFAHERSYLARLTAVVGPLPSTPGQAESDAAFTAQRRAFEMLARSDRIGCAYGAALALVIDWQAFRRILDAAAQRAGIPLARAAMPDERDVAERAATPAPTPAIQRAMAFGAQQAFAQHRGLCDLIEARAAARDLL